MGLFLEDRGLGGELFCLPYSTRQPRLASRGKAPDQFQFWPWQTRIVVDLGEAITRVLMEYRLFPLPLPTWSNLAVAEALPPKLRYNLPIKYPVGPPNWAILSRSATAFLPRYRCCTIPNGNYVQSCRGAKESVQDDILELRTLLSQNLDEVLEMLAHTERVLRSTEVCSAECGSNYHSIVNVVGPVNTAVPKVLP